jgi:predicted nucleotidyltransferase
MVLSMHLHEKKVLQQISRSLRERFPERITAVLAFGSRVRGNHGPWSDFDVLIVVRDKTPQIENDIIGLFVDEEMKLGVNFTPVVKDAGAFEQEKKFHTPFYENLAREGVLL